jgi:hypothetical protein
MINTAGGENQEASDEDMEFPQEGGMAMKFAVFISGCIKFSLTYFHII